MPSTWSEPPARKRPTRPRTCGSSSSGAPARARCSIWSLAPRPTPRSTVTTTFPATTSGPWPSLCCGTESCPVSPPKRRASPRWTSSSNCWRKSGSRPRRTTRRSEEGRADDRPPRRFLSDHAAQGLGMQSATLDPPSASDLPPHLADPRIVTGLGDLRLLARRVVEGFISGMHKSPFQGFSIEFSQNREYSPGDELRHIDWKVFAKTDRYYVKQYEAETNLRATIILDSSGSMGFASDSVTKLQ